MKSYKKELETDQTRLSEISSDLRTFTEDVEDLKISLANKPYLIIKGRSWLWQVAFNG